MEKYILEAMQQTSYSHDILVIGSGAAGLKLALDCASSTKVALLAKQALTESNTYYAQGGISVVLNSNDSLESHIEDTLKAGCGLCDEKVVRHVVTQAKKNIQWLIDEGIHFTQEANIPNSHAYHLTREGGHSHRRVIHAADATGKAIGDTLVKKVLEHPNIETFDHHMAVDLIMQNRLTDTTQYDADHCLGAYVLDVRQNKVKTLQARCTVLATGGAGKVYLYTSNPDIASGDGVAMGWRAGCHIANMEFFQFHPTCLYHPQAKSFLISEAIRGEGAHLLLPDGSRFMHRFDAASELAPRDVVARAIDFEMKRLGADCLYLDVSFKPKEFIQKSFPTIYEKCLQLGIDITKQPIPVVPASHYMCGGIMTDIEGKTNIDGLFAIGETAYTGVHGANRMASNSLLECLVFGESTGHAVLDFLQSSSFQANASIPEWDDSQVTQAREEVVISHNWDELRRMMWDYVGIVRTSERLESAMKRIALLKSEVNRYYQRFRITSDLLELRNLVDVAELIIHSALQRKESRGLHYNVDYPKADTSLAAKPTVIKPKATN